MIHPDLELRFISVHKGYGLFARKPIPRGSITFVQDDLDIHISPQDPRVQDPRYAAIIDRYAYRDAEGHYVISWDAGKYMNHCCHANSLTCGYGFEIAIRDIAAGEEVTDDYRIFAAEHALEIECDSKACPAADPCHDLVQEWDRLACDALLQVNRVAQPLWGLLDPDLQVQIGTDLETGMFPSVATQIPTPLAPKMPEVTGNSQETIAARPA